MKPREFSPHMLNTGVLKAGGIIAVARQVNVRGNDPGPAAKDRGVADDLAAAAKAAEDKTTCTRVRVARKPLVPGAEGHVAEDHRARLVNACWPCGWWRRGGAGCRDGGGRHRCGGARDEGNRSAEATLSVLAVRVATDDAVAAAWVPEGADGRADLPFACLACRNAGEMTSLDGCLRAALGCIHGARDSPTLELREAVVVLTVGPTPLRACLSRLTALLTLQQRVMPKQASPTAENTASKDENHTPQRELRMPPAPMT
eukprot:CAMPEP_0197893520 /NCGR_PEP_ID=MMETSP1439-20131203/32800_1 /TAXON_ID=66791 /ORGANISM="Gonyaulax spinifera, Strain CCMP409" /LENGTH=258 /DNA_ID=CAMNT_0043513791 /DNA_START=457 /DNA_END=1233 /DNA_ORIENTATION=+